MEASPRTIVRLCDLKRKPGVTGYNEPWLLRKGLVCWSGGDFFCRVMSAASKDCLSHYTTKESLDVHIGIIHFIRSSPSPFHGSGWA